MIYIHEDVIKGHHIYKEMWTSACGEVLENFETFRRLFQEVLAILDDIALKIELRYYLNCAYSRKSTGYHSILLFKFGDDYILGGLVSRYIHLVNLNLAG